MNDGVREAQRKLGELLERAGPGPVMVHTDVLRALRFVEPTIQAQVTLDRHLRLLEDVLEGRPLWMPAFNYDYGTTRVFNIGSDSSQVGALSEHFRLNGARWRSAVPMFSIAGTGPVPEAGQAHTVTEPFGEKSAFAELVQNNGTLLFYGAPFASATIIHYVEQSAGPPAYRYDKAFHGKVILEDASEVETNLKIHVRPMGRRLEYDWARLETTLLMRCILDGFRSSWTRAFIVSPKSMFDAFSEEMAADATFLLDQASRDWVVPMLQKLGRRFEITDFEGVLTQNTKAPGTEMANGK